MSRRLRKRHLSLRAGGLSVIGGVGLLSQVLAISGLQALYDPSDLTSLYQSRTGGSTGAVDSVVGIMLDKSEMGGRTAAAFIAGQSNVWVDANAVVQGESQIVSPGVFRIYTSVGTFSSIQIAATLTVGAWYEVRYTIDSIATVGGGVRGIDAGAIHTTTGAKSEIFKADNTIAGVKRVGGATDIQISNVQYRLIPGYHALAPSDAARPILRSASSKNYLDLDGTDDWMQVFPTLDLGATWWHVGGWTLEASGANAFALSSAAGSAAYKRDTAAGQWLSSAPAYAAVHTGNPTNTHVVTLEHSGYAGTLAGRYNGGGGASLTPYNYSAETKALALFSRSNAAWNLGLDGRFYGGAFGTGTLSSSDRSLLERYVAGLTGVTI